MRRPDSRTVVVTGASAGIGRAVVQEFARHGARLGLLARGTEGLMAARREALEAGCRVLAVPADVADAEAVEEAARRIEEVLGPIDVWINNAMVTVFAPFGELTPAEFERVTRVTYLGYVHGTMAALRRMQPRGQGVIVQVGSALAYRSIPLQSAYCGAKAAIRGFTDSLRSELRHARSQVQLTMVQLPAHNTPQFVWGRSRMPRRAQPVPPIFQPEVAARAIRWATLHPRREVWVGWPTYQAILGQRVAPGWLDGYLAERAYEGQLTGEAATEHPDNLFQPVSGDRGAHGPFDARSQGFSALWWAQRHRRGLLAAGAGLAGLAGLMWGRSRS